MFEIVKAIQDALRTESTAAFVIAIGLAFGLVGRGLAWVADRAYKNNRAAEAERTKLEYAVSATIIFENHRLVMINRGRTNLNIWGAVYGTGATVTTEAIPRVIAPTDNYYFSAVELENQLRANIPRGRNGSVPYFAFVATEDGKRNTPSSIYWWQT